MTLNPVQIMSGDRDGFHFTFRNIIMMREWPDNSSRDLPAVYVFNLPLEGGRQRFATSEMIIF